MLTAPLQQAAVPPFPALPAYGERAGVRRRARVGADASARQEPKLAWMPACAGMTMVGVADVAPISTSSPRRRGSTQVWGLVGALILALAALFLLALPAVAQPKFPALTGRIVDEARLLKSEDLSAIAADLKALQAKSSDQLVIYTTRSLQGYAIEDFGYQLGRTWGIGQRGVNNGVLLIVAPNERKVRIEVGRGLEPYLTDAMTKLIIENAILPAFRRGDFSGGIRAGVHDIIGVMTGDADAVKQRLAAGTKRSASPGDNFALYLLVFFIFAAVFMVWMQQRQMAHPLKPGQRRRNAGSSWAAGPSWGSSSGSWSGGSSSSDSGGSFSGGGGDFGGGGSSGSW